MRPRFMKIGSRSFTIQTLSDQKSDRILETLNGGFATKQSRFFSRTSSNCSTDSVLPHDSTSILNHGRLRCLQQRVPQRLQVCLSVCSCVCMSIVSYVVQYVCVCVCVSRITSDLGGKVDYYFLCREESVPESGACVPNHG